MTITIRPRWSLGRGKTLVPSRWQATCRDARARLRDAEGHLLANAATEVDMGKPSRRPTIDEVMASIRARDNLAELVRDLANTAGHASTFSSSSVGYYAERIERLCPEGPDRTRVQGLLRDAAALDFHEKAQGLYEAAVIVADMAVQEDVLTRAAADEVTSYDLFTETLSRDRYMSGMSGAYGEFDQIDEL